MEKRTRTSSKAKDFFKKNMYYLIMAVCLIAVAAMITVTVLMRNANQNIIDQPNEPVITDPDPIVDPDPVVNPDPIVDPDPVVTPIVFACPVDNVNIVQDYAEHHLVWYTSLEKYATHTAIDFGGKDGDKVYAAYGGVVSKIEQDPFVGNVVTIKHSDKLYTRYESLNTPTVTVGQQVLKGAQIGTMSNTASREYSLGAHLDFSVWENGVEVSPYTYLAIGDK